MADNYTFVNYGGALQLQIQNAEQLTALAQLDDPFWMATSAPTHQLRLPTAVKRQLDPDNNDRILSEDVRRTVSWVLHVQGDLQSINQRVGRMPLSAFRTDTLEGKRMNAVALHVLNNMGASDSQEITLDQLLNRKRIFSNGTQNGDGVIPLNTANSDNDLKQLMVAVQKCTGGTQDVNGEMGVSRKNLDTFIADAKAVKAWWDKRQGDSESIFPLGEKTRAAWKAVSALQSKIDLYFNLCRLTEMGVFEPQNLLPKGLFSEDNPAEMLLDEKLNAFVRSAPIAPPQIKAILDFQGTLNPFFRDKLGTLKEAAIEPLLLENFDGQHLSETQWIDMKSRLNAYQSWIAAKPNNTATSLEQALIEQCLGSGAIETLYGLISHDEAAKDEMDDIEDLECLLCLQSNLLDICNNFVSFPHLYDPELRAAFESGCLVMDGRILNLTIKVKDVKSHAKAAERSGIFLLYCEILDAKNSSKFYTVTPVTAGRIRQLQLGKRGVLFDLDGQQYDARVIQVVDNPVSLTEALIGPIRKLSDKAAGFFRKLVSDAEKQVDAAIDKNLNTIQKDMSTGIQAVAEQKEIAPVPEVSPKSPPLRDMMLSASVAVAALGSSFAFITQTFANLDGSTIAVAFAMVPFLVLFPTIIITAIRLKKRNLSAILEASGWAFNAPMYLTWTLGRVLTITPKRPTNIKVLSRDRLRSLRNKTKKGFLPTETQRSHEMASRGRSRR